MTQIILQPLPDIQEKRPLVSLVLSTYNRPDGLGELLAAIGSQTMNREDFEVIIVDDGSKVPVKPIIDSQPHPFNLTVIEQENGGQAIARHRGIQLAKGELIIIIDDDMWVPDDFIEAHLRCHQQRARVVLGDIRPTRDIAKRPIFERAQAYQFARFGERMKRGEPAKGNFWTGNVSFRKSDYELVGGFDPSLRRSEDKELGIRFEKLMGHLGNEARVWSESAYVIHNSDHDQKHFWLNRSFNYGIYDSRIGKKHHDFSDANPWSFIFKVNPMSRVPLMMTVAAPSVAKNWSAWTLSIAEQIDKLGAEKAAIAITTLAYGLNYFRGVREEAGSLKQSIQDMEEYLRKIDTPESGAQLRNWAAAAVKFKVRVAADVAKIRNRHRIQHDGQDASSAKVIAHDVGLQILLGVRLMQFFRDTGQSMQSNIVSRMIRHLYAADIHPDAKIEPGISIVHGNGVVIGGDVTIGKGCIIFQNATLGDGRDPITGKTGSPTLGENVHIGPGSSLFGPITVGANSKLMAGTVLVESLPPNSRAKPADTKISARDDKKHPAR
ncbi:MAG: glycosyltransferase [Deltaproteobacteria bacterium]|nr:glycosyltransferase [Deltaproteobacteria bacterium]